MAVCFRTLQCISAAALDMTDKFCAVPKLLLFRLMSNVSYTLLHYMWSYRIGWHHIVLAPQFLNDFTPCALKLHVRWNVVYSRLSTIKAKMNVTE